MNQARTYARRNGLLWVLYLAVALLFVQGTNVHMHVYDHAHEDGLVLVGHSHSHSAHFCDNVCDTVHHHDSEIEMDITPEGGIKFPSFASLVFALLSISLGALLFALVVNRLRHYPENDPLTASRRSNLRPPLRAPPL